VINSAALRTEVLMGTLVTIEVVGTDADASIERAFEWFRAVEDACTRFDERSELMQLVTHVGVPVTASAILYEAVRFALHVAHESGGAFDPTVGHQLLRRGFNRHHKTGATVTAVVEPPPDVSYRDVHVNADYRTITLHRPVLLDLGGVAKGLAIDLAARELQPFTNFAIDAGGDIYVGGQNADGQDWSVGIRHPRTRGAVVDAVRVSNVAVCTSGDYERESPSLPNEHHIVDPRTGHAPSSSASATVVAPTAMLADALATAAFVLGPIEGIALLDRLGVEGLIVTDDLQRVETAGWPRA
jgi:thiamine biosynthesis lipoprotein